MKQLKIIEAYKAIQKMMDEPLTIGSSYKIFKLKKKLQDQWDFQYDEEQKLLSELQPDMNSDGMKFASTEDADKYRALIKELSNIDVDIEGLPIQIPLTENITLSPANIEALDGFIEFYEEA